MLMLDGVEVNRCVVIRLRKRYCRQNIFPKRNVNVVDRSTYCDTLRQPLCVCDGDAAAGLVLSSCAGLRR